MSSDNSDKTIFRQPANSSSPQGGDHTVLKPTPGRRGAAPPQAPTPPSPAVPHPGQRGAGQVAHGEMPNRGSQATQFRTAHGLNPLVNAAATLIAVFEKTHKSMSHPNVGGLHQQLVNEIKAFEMRAKEQGLKPEIVLSTRYILCTVLDEAVLNTPWGAESAWTQRTLLSMFHNETSGGEKFYMILDRMRETPAENLYILELMYIFLSLGFEGKYRVIHRGRDKLEQIRDELFRIIRNHRGEYERALSPSWQGLGKIRNSLAQYIPMWVVASFVGAFLLLSYSGFRYWLYHSSSSVAQQLTDISQSKPASQKSRIRIPD